MVSSPAVVVGIGRMIIRPRFSIKVVDDDDDSDTGAGHTGSSPRISSRSKSRRIKQLGSDKSGIWILTGVSEAGLGAGDEGAVVMVRGDGLGLISGAAQAERISVSVF